MNLNPKQKAFADFYIETGNASEAARKAGYSQKNANVNGPRLLANAGIKEYINNRMAELESRRAMTADEVMLFYSAVVRGEVKDQFGLEVSVADRIKAADSLMKRFNAITPKAEKHSDTVSAIIKAVEAVE
jgi:phage terminase small subunit